MKSRHAAALEERTIGGLHASLLPRIKPLDDLSLDLPILDLACGTGAWLKRLHDAGYRDLWGMDRDVPGFGAANVAHFIPANLDSANGISAQAGNRQFALVTMIEIIEHVADPERLVRLAHDALKPGGWMLITSPNIYSLRPREVSIEWGRSIF
jgi:2-polyprenyl-3-methyl-5-hydroxy-6-metoxy-1,4-benzoquinol methylase